jgi:hypothetical protein
VHVYSSGTLVQRFSLSQATGQWLDYWTLLHSRETPFALAARPISLRSLLSAALAASGDSRQPALLEAATSDLRTYTRLNMILPLGVPPGPAIEKRDRARYLSKSWNQWIVTLLEKEQLDLIPALLRELERELAENALSAKSAFLTRRLASEAADQRTSDQLLNTAIKALMAGARNVRQMLTMCFEAQDIRAYRVEFSLSPQMVGKTLPLAFGDPRFHLLKEDRPEGRFVTGAAVRVNAIDSDNAAEAGCEIAAEALQTLRVRYYVRTHLYGGIRVISDEGEMRKPLPQPFWDKMGGRRRIPTISRETDELIIESKSRLTAARSQVAHAIAMFPEDPHGSASLTWQSFEAIWPRLEPKAVQESLSLDYLASLSRDLPAYLSGKLVGQRNLMRRAHLPNNWYTGSPDEDWLSAIFDGASPRFYKRWYPVASEALFAPDFGVLRVARDLASGNRRFLDARISADLRHLYALRNAVAHSGQRVGNRRWGMYMARMGLELAIDHLGGHGWLTRELSGSR